MARPIIPTSKYDTELVAGSIKGAMKDASAGSGDLWMVPVSSIHRLEGFNVRVPTQDYQDHVEAVAQSMLANGFYRDKPVDGFVGKTQDGANVIFLTGGYTRLAAVEIANEKGAEIDKVPVIVKPPTDNMVDLTVALLQGNEGRPLTPLEKAIVVKRLQGYGVENGEIAKRLGMTDRYVLDMEVLAGASPKIRNLLVAGKISATEAVKQIRKNPAKAAERLSAGVQAATEAGKSKATAKDVKAATEAEDGGKTKIEATARTTKRAQIDKTVFRLKGGEKVRKDSVASILTADGGSFWREAEELDDAKEGEIIITKTVTITLIVEQAAPESDAAVDETENEQDGGGDALTEEQIDASLETSNDEDPPAGDEAAETPPEDPAAEL